MNIDILIDNKYSFLNLWKYQIKHTINKFNHRVRAFKYHKKIKYIIKIFKKNEIKKIFLSK